MKKKIIFNATPTHYNALLLEDNELAEYHQEKRDLAYQVGNVYLGTVKKIISSLNAAFVDIGHEKLAFLHYSDVSPYVLTFQKYTQNILKNKKKIPNISAVELEKVTDKNGQIKNVLKEGEKLIVQISKEPISTKGIRITTCINLSGRYLILTPFHNAITISKKIGQNSEKKRLEQLVTSLKRNNFGVIVRTLAEKKEAALLDKDFEQLIQSWEQGMKKLHESKNKSSACLIQSPGAFYTLLQDLLSEEFDQIVVDDIQMHQEIKSYVKKVLPEKEKIVHLYQGRTNIFNYLGIEKKIKNLLSKIVALPGGGYLIIEHTEAMHVIDVNTGNRGGIGVDQETLALEVNLEAAKVIADLIRFRGDKLGGITVIDFVGLRLAQHRRQLHEVMKKSLSRHRFKVDITPITKFGLMEITRPRTRSFGILEEEIACSSCQGTGIAKPSEDIAEDLEHQIRSLFKKTKTKKLTLHLHPFLYAYINRGLLPKTWQWWWQFNRSITICEDPTLSITDYNILDRKGNLLAEAPKITPKDKFTYEFE